MKQNKTALSHIIACFIAAATLAGCTWDSSLYDEFVNKNSDTVTSCPGRLGITLPNGVYAYQDGTNSNTYYCGTYDDIGKNTNILDDIMCENYINSNNNKSGFSSYEEFKDYFNHMTGLFAKDGSPICPGNTESCSTLYVRISTQQTPTLAPIAFCNACHEGTAMDSTGTCVSITPTITCDTATSHYYNGECIPNDLANCGKHNHNCENVLLGWDNGTCDNATCVPSNCKKGYHLENNDDQKSCVADNNNNCGSEGHKCGLGQVCIQGECSDNCGSGEVRCEKDGNVSCADPMTSTTFCGADDACSDGSYETCADGQACVDGFCEQNTCTNDAETLCVVDGKNTCIALDSDNPDHCGACNLKCSNLSAANASSTTCLDGKCQYICESGYTNCGDTTVPNCLNEDHLKNDPNNCGTCGKTCNADEFCNDGTCQKSTCTNACLSNGTCVNRNDACGTQCINCNSANYAASGTCTDKGVCTITSCITGFHLTETKTCALNTPTACGSTAKTDVSNCMEKSKTHATDAYCNASGQCVATSCETGYHVVKGECVKDSPTACGASAADCTKLAGWNGGKCENGQCKATACTQGYCLNTTTCVDGAYNARMCGMNGGACISCNTESQSCVMGGCVTSSCDENVCFYQGETCENMNNHCGKNCVNCNTANNASAGTCNVDTGTCTITDCARGYHKSDTKCVENSNTQCAPTTGGTVKDCTKDDHATSGICNAEGKCVATSCETGYHVVNDACVEDSDTACGASATNCKDLVGWNGGKCENGQCKATACTQGYCLNEHETCVDGAYNAIMCGITGGKCISCSIDSNQSCVKGQCVTSSCDANTCFYLGTTCSNTNDHCGATCTDCATIKNAENATCTSDTGLCEITMCLPGYHIKKAGGKHDMCEQNTSDKCAEPSSDETKTCAVELQVSDETKHIQTVDCSPEGTCMITECSPGYHVNDENSACVEDSEAACGAAVTDCTTLEGWKEGECTNGACVASACQDNYVLEDGTCVEDETILLCGGTNCNAIAHVKLAFCNVDACYVAECNPGYAPNDEHNACVCDEGACQADKFPWVESAACNADKTACVLSCPADQHLSPDKTDCVDNTDEACAPQDAHIPENCTEIDESTHIANRTCQSGACKITECQPGYHIATDGLTCAVNSNTACAPVNSSDVKSCADPNPKCGNAGECCRANDSSDPKLTSKPTCCNNNCKKKNSSGTTYYRCSAPGGWSAC